jgi:hypothetical protein
MAEPGIEPGTLLIIVRNSDYQATRLVTLYKIHNNKLCAVICKICICDLMDIKVCVLFEEVRFV